MTIHILDTNHKDKSSTRPIVANCGRTLRYPEIVAADPEHGNFCGTCMKYHTKFPALYSFAFVERIKS